MPDEVQQDSEVRKLWKWLEKQGYSLQMRVAQVFEQAGFEVSQSENYVDPDENRFREIDVVASTSCEFDGLTVSVAFLMECKHADTPWVVFASPKHLDKAFHFSRILRTKLDVRDWHAHDSIQARIVARLLTAPTFEGAGERGFFSVPGYVGYGVVQSDLKGSHKENAKGSHKDNAYSAVMQVSSCIRAYDIQDEATFRESVEDYERRALETESRVGKLSNYARITFPVVVVRGHLFECCLDQNGDVALSMVKNSVVLVPSKGIKDAPLVPSCMSAVRIVAEEDIESFAAEAHKAAISLLSEKKAIQEVWDFECQKLPARREIDELPF